MSADTTHTITTQTVDVSDELIEAIESFPQQRLVEHCGQTFTAPALDIYTDCPSCGTQIKLRSFGAGIELEDVFDAVLEWMCDPIARHSAEQRLRTIEEDR